MLWRIWTLLVSVLRWMTPRPGFLLPMSVNGAGRKAAIGAASSGDALGWTEQKAEFLRNPSLRRSRELQQEQWNWQQQKQKQRTKEQQQHHRRRFFDFGFGSGGGSKPSEATSTNANSKPTAEETKPKNTSHKWRKRQPSTNAFIFVTPPSVLLPPPPTVTIQDFSNTPLPPSLTLPLTLNLPPPLPLSLALPPGIGALEAVGKSNAPPRPPRPPSGPIPRVVVTPCAPAVLEGIHEGAGDGSVQTPHLHMQQPRNQVGARDTLDSERQQHFRSSSGRHLSPEWGVRSPPSSSSPSSSPSSSTPTAPTPATLAGHASGGGSSRGGHARKGSVQLPGAAPSTAVNASPGVSAPAGGHPNSAPAQTNFSRPRSSPSSRDSQPSVYSDRDSQLGQPGGAVTTPRQMGLSGGGIVARSRFSVSSSVSTSSSSSSSSSTGSASSFQSNSVHDVHDVQHSTRKIGLGIHEQAGIQAPAEGLNPSGSFLSTISEAGSFASLPHSRSGPLSASEAYAQGSYAHTAQVQVQVPDQSESQTQTRAGARKVHLPDEQLDLLPYPEVFDLDIYFSHSHSQSHSQAHRRTSIYDLAYAPSSFLPTSQQRSHQQQQQRLSLCVLRNARVEDIHRLQMQIRAEVEQEELQSRQFESESVKDFTALNAFVPSPPALHGYLGLGSDGDGDSDLGHEEDSDGDGTESERARERNKERDKENRVPPSARAHPRLRRVPTSPSPSRVHEHARSRSVGGEMLRMRSHTHPRTPHTYIQDAERQAAEGGTVFARAGVGAATRPILRQVGNIGPSTTTRTTITAGKAASVTLQAQSPTSTSSNPSSSRPPSTSTLRVLVPSPPALGAAQVRPLQVGSSSDRSTHSHPHSHSHVARPPAPAAHLQICIPGLSQRIVNRTKESELSPIKEAFHPPSMAVLTPPPPSPPSHTSTFTSGDKNGVEKEKEDQPGRSPRPRTLPIVIVSHHRFGSVSEYESGGRGDESGNDSGSESERDFEHDGHNVLHHRYRSGSSDEENYSVRRSYASGEIKTRVPGHGHAQGGRAKGNERRRKRRGRWPSSDLAYMDEESGMEVVSLH